MAKHNSIHKTRKDRSLSIVQKRIVAAFSVLGIIDYSIISLYQLCYIRSLPDYLFNMVVYKKICSYCGDKLYCCKASMGLAENKPV